MIDDAVWLFLGPSGRALLAWALMALLLALMATAIVHDATRRQWVWLVLDIALPPVGIVRGVMVWMEKA